MTGTKSLFMSVAVILIMVAFGYSSMTLGISLCFAYVSVLSILEAIENTNKIIVKFRESIVPGTYKGTVYSDEGIAGILERMNREVASINDSIGAIEDSTESEEDEEETSVLPLISKISDNIQMLSESFEEFMIVAREQQKRL